MAVQIQLRRGLSSEWISVNPTLGEGELGLELDTLKFKFGDGISSWNTLEYPSYTLSTGSLGTAAYLNVGVGSGNVVQLTGESKLPSVNGENLTGMYFGGFPIIKNCKFSSIYGGNLPIGITDLYTVPSGKKSFISQVGRIYNTSTGSISANAVIKIEENYYDIGGINTLTTGTGANPNFLMGFILNEGESFSYRCSLNSGLNVRFAVLEFSSVEENYNTARILQLSSGSQVLFTVPENKSAGGISNIGFYRSTCVVSNFTGSSVNYSIHVVPSGSIADTSNQLFPFTSLTNGNSLEFAFGISTLSEGESIVINSTSSDSGQLAYFTYFIL